MESDQAELKADIKSVLAGLNAIDLALVEIKSALGAYERENASLRSDFKETRHRQDVILHDLAEIKGRLSQVPNVLQLLAITISTWMAGAGMVFALLKFGFK